MATYKAEALVMPNGDEIKYDESVFVAEYGVTPYAEVQAAENAGKVLFCIRGGFVYSYADFKGSYEFWLSNNTGIVWVSVDSSNNWTNGSYKNTAYSKTSVSPNSNYAIALAGFSEGQYTRSNITFGSSTTQYLSNKGTWVNIPVTSVNGQTGAVSLTIPTVPTNVSAFNNDAGYLTSNDIGSVFTLKGSVYQYSDLPTTGNTEGDVYYVEEDETISGTLYPGQVGYIWITDSNNVARWEELGQTIDTSEFQPLITTNGVLQGNGSGNISAITVDTTPTANSANLVTSGGVRAAIPTNVSSLNNDSGYLTLATLPIWDGTVQ